MHDNVDELHLALINSYMTHKKRSFQCFQDLDLTTGQPKVLTVLNKDEGYLQKDLAKRCHVEPATMTSLLNNMEKKNLIYKEPVYVSGGKRANSVYLTEKGRQLANKVIEIVNNIEEISFKNFNDDEKYTLINLLNRVTTNLETI
ncbi:MAG: MarR family transcriptional regulator [Clostridiales bacterium]|nr:MarR family transcriptional regulator [Clostridiales bacterium]